MSRQKDIGTRAETALVRYARARTGSDAVDRIALHGGSDEGDVGHIPCHGLEGFAEVKNYKGNATDGQLDRWRQETLRERGNGGWGFGLLVVHRAGCNMTDPTAPSYGRNYCHMTLGDLARVSGVGPVAAAFLDETGKWCSMTLRDAFDLIGGAYDGLADED